MLNSNQKKAVNYMGGYGFVSSIPGSGKTRVLTERTVALLKKGVDPSRILCITFTNKAANEMRKRVEGKIGKEAASKIIMSTFHSLGAKILRKEADSIPFYNKDFTIVGVDDQIAILERAAKDLGLEAKTRKNKDGVDLMSVMAAIGRKKDKLDNFAKFSDEHDVTTCQIFNYYKNYLLKTNCMDFGDLLFIFYTLLTKRKKVLSKYANRFSYIMVDECQDLNYCQYEIVKLLASRHHNLLLIGDIDQSIYRFRQADPKHVFNYLKEKEVDRLPLSLNYRSTKRILKCADSVIRKNSNRTSEVMETTNKIGHHVNIVREKTGYSEQEWVANQIDELVTNTDYKYSDFAILYRVNALSRGFEQALRCRKIPCKIIGGTSFFDFEVVKTCLSYLQFYANPDNVLAFHKIVNKPRRFIADGMVNKIEEYCFEHRCKVVDALQKIESVEIAKIGTKRTKALRDLYNALRPKPEEDISVYSTAERIFKDTGLEDFFMEDDKADAKKGEKAGKSGKSEIYKSLMCALSDWDENSGGTLPQFLEFINLQSSTDDSDDSDSVKLMTTHSSKGLEFPIVFLTCVEEGTYPHKFSIETGDPEDIEEERRLFYVGMTRAEERLYATFSQARTVYGKCSEVTPSRFLKEMVSGGALVLDYSEDER